MATQPIITREVVSKMISLIDWCYRMGVSDAHKQSDEGLVREFCERTKEPGVFGFLTDDFSISWQEFALRLLSKARMTSWNGSMARYMNQMGRYGNNYLSCFLPLAQIWYCKGCKDYADAPTSCDMAVFNGRTRVYWTANGVRKVDNRRYVDELQLETFVLERRDGAVREANTEYDAKKAGALKPKHYQYFRTAIGLALTTK